MVILMNKKEFIKELSNKLDYSEEQCIIINSILEDNFFISKKSKDKIIDELIEKLNVDYEKAEVIYNTCVEIATKSIKEKLRHPFRKKD